MTINFKNLEASEMVRENVEGRISTVIEKFPDIDARDIKIILEMHNSRLQAGPDLFSVQLNVLRGRYKNLKITKSSTHFYIALSELCDRLLDSLNRHGDKKRVKSRKQSRALQEPQVTDIESEID